jgi:hygromycin-B 4-O-kinase
MYKTQIYKNQVNRFLDEYFRSFVDNIIEIASGEFSQAYSFEHRNNKFIVRFNSYTDLGFKKEEIIYSDYTSISTPRIIEIGKYKDFYFSITKAYEGIQLNKLHKDSFLELLPDLFSTMNTLHTIKIEQEGYGLWDLDKKGKFESFEDQLRSFIKEDKWEDFAKQNKFFNIEFVRNLMKEFESLIKYIPSERYFLHGDFGRTNIFALDNKIEGIIDWSEAMYGDFLMDVAWLAFWESKVNIIDEYYKFNKDNKDLDMSNFQERIKLYLIFSSLNNIIFEVERGRELSYGNAVESAKRNLKM